MKKDLISSVVPQRLKQMFKMVSTKITKILRLTKTRPIIQKNQTLMKTMRISSVNLTSLSRVCLTMRKKCLLSYVMVSKGAPTIWPWFIKESKHNCQTPIIFCQGKTKMTLNPTSKEWEKNLQIKSSTSFVALWTSKL